MLRRPTHTMARVLIWLALFLGGAGSVTYVQALASPAVTSAAAEKVREPLALRAHAMQDLGALHQHDNQSPCGHGNCPSCCPSCSNASLGFTLAIDGCSLVGPVAEIERCPLAGAERLQPWLSLLPFRPPCPHA